MKDYELTLVLNPNLAENEREELVGSLKEFIEGKGGQAGAVDVWGKRELAYSLSKQNQGVYILLNFSTDDSQFLVVLEKKIKIMDNVLRHLLVRNEPHFTKASPGEKEVEREIQKVKSSE